ncbi:hypothetical protein PS862_05762 [Pseudomonas fluorescens]|uniref:Uncharacterized protein n=1 Tax=Pseudomonas fluorescens TaxID=294 RepID=A0A5E7Q3S5_PSEFL|nr:hypothetical protein PS862_05762 [Pseudomonas fluorescens]
MADLLGGSVLIRDYRISGSLICFGGGLPGSGQEELVIVAREPRRRMLCS